MIDIDLTDIKPEDAEITIGGGVDHDNNPIEKLTLTLRKINLDDEAWLKSEFGKDQNPFTEKMTDEQLCKIAFHQLAYDDKLKFQPRDVKFFNDETGEATTHKVGGWRLFRMMLAGLNQKAMLLKAILYTAGVSRPMLEKILTPDELKQLGITKDKEDSSKKKRSTGRR